MKSSWFVFLIALACCFSGAAQDFRQEGRAQRESIKDWKAIYLKINPLTILQGPIIGASEYRLGFEAMAAPRLSYQPSISYLGKSPLFNLLFPDSAIAGVTSQDFVMRGYRLQGQLRYFYLMFSKKGANSLMRPSGLYFALHASYSTVTFRWRSTAYPRTNINHFNVNSLFGIQFLISDAVGLDVFTGVGYKQNTIYDVDRNQVATKVDLEDEGFGLYYRSNLKLTLGFNLAIGLW